MEREIDLILGLDHAGVRALDQPAPRLDQGGLGLPSLPIRVSKRRTLAVLNRLRASLSHNPGYRRGRTGKPQIQKWDSVLLSRFPRCYYAAKAAAFAVEGSQPKG